eukprot:TRINITY_DN197_c0_g2_i6.p2 TRINITY_DN197_c0_g2~~TRINITY_DN197_c0_g2_i6.p2  ORF type:complete len:108 (+),score=2.84 TRINITY_DN197_c0_g2_i6:117-440(+)
MIHLIMRFTLVIAFRCALHRCENQDIRCLRLFWFWFWLCFGGSGRSSTKRFECDFPVEQAHLCRNGKRQMRVWGRQPDVNVGLLPQIKGLGEPEALSSAPVQANLVH